MDEERPEDRPLPDDLNAWGKENFDEVHNMFQKILNRNKNLYTKTEKPVTVSASDKPNREQVIRKDDVTDLKILLESARSVEDFIKNM